MRFCMMGGGDPRTLVLVGKTGNGKSATGNSILGKKMFQSKRSFCGVTSSCELKTSVMEDGQILDVIDTPGLFYSSVDLETNGKEIASCIKLAIDGIHAILVVFSVCNRFFEEEKAAISSLQYLFGKQICDYMIVVFTGGDDIEEDGKTFEDFLCDSPEALKEILCLCGNRYVLFDNRTKDETKKANQVQQLLSLVNMVLENNGGKPYTNEIFTDLKKWSSELEGQTEEFRVLKDTEGHSERKMLELMEKMHVEHLKRTNEMFWQMTLEMKLKFEQQLLEEQAARLNAEKNAEAARNKAKEDIALLGEKLREAKRREEEVQKESSMRMVQMKSKFDKKLLEEQAARMKLEFDKKLLEENGEAARMEYKRELFEELEANQLRLKEEMKIARRKTEEDLERMIQEAKRREEETKWKELEEFYGKRAIGEVRKREELKKQNLR